MDYYNFNGSDFKNKENEYINAINKSLESYMSGITQPLLREAMSYSLFAGGKRLRPLLLLAASASEGGNVTDSMPFACALECIHTYSLIHDDLPALDNDDLRRGKPTNHIKFGEAAAILSGDGLLNIAVEIMAAYCVLNPQTKNLYSLNEIVKAAGVNGMISGQMDDIRNENKKLCENELIYIYERKTGKLIKSAIVCGAVLGGRCISELAEIETAAKNLGEAFQIKDDILDVTSNSSNLGKPAKSDERNKKNTYAAVFGLSAAESRFIRLSGAAVETFAAIYGKKSFLTSLAEKITYRTN